MEGRPNPVGGSTHTAVHVKVEPPARFELATSSLPMRCYTSKPRWRKRGDLPSRYNRFGNAFDAGQPFRLNRGGLSGGLLPRSHSLVSRVTGNHVGPFPRGFKSLSRRLTNKFVGEVCQYLIEQTGASLIVSCIRRLRSNQYIARIAVWKIRQ